MDALELSPSASIFQVLGVTALMWQVGDTLPKGCSDASGLTAL